MLPLNQEYEVETGFFFYRDAHVELVGKFSTVYYVPCEGCTKVEKGSGNVVCVYCTKSGSR